MEIVVNTGGVAATNAYLVGDETTKKAVIIDAPDHTIAGLADEAFRRGYDVTALWLTHGHFDHLADHKVVTDRFPNAKLLMHRLDEAKLQDPRSVLFPLPFTIPPRNADQYIEDGQELSVGQLKAQVIHTPGHAPGHVAFYFPDESVLISGDLIFVGSVGRTDFPDSDIEQLFDSLVKILKLPGDTQVLPGHGEATTLDAERRHNPYVQEARDRTA